jgi:hypothetical protein
MDRRAFLGALTWYADGWLTPLEGDPCEDYATALAASWRLRPTPRDREGTGLMNPEKGRRGRLLYIALGFLGLDVPPAAMPRAPRAPRMARYLARHRLDRAGARAPGAGSLAHALPGPMGGTGVRHRPRALHHSGLRVADDTLGRRPAGRIPDLAPRPVLERPAAGTLAVPDRGIAALRLPLPTRSRTAVTTAARLWYFSRLARTYNRSMTARGRTTSARRPCRAGPRDS